MPKESTRQEIIKLLNENKTVDQIVNTLKVAKGYVYSVRSSLKHPSSRKGKLVKRLDQLGVEDLPTSTTVKVRCKYCKSVHIITINPTHKELYTKEVIDNYVCFQYQCQSKKKWNEKLGR